MIVSHSIVLINDFGLRQGSTLGTQKEPAIAPKHRHQTLAVGAGAGNDYAGERLEPVESGGETYTFERIAGSGSQQAEPHTRLVTHWMLLAANQVSVFTVICSRISMPRPSS
jgi:hypothetical protein